MGREILFRGKRKYSGKWVEGSYCPKKTGHYEGDKFVEETQRLIIVNMTGGGYQYVDVDPETVCQYTGLTDKNGRKIFEGDILKRVLLPTKRIENNFRIAFVPVKSCFSAIDLDGSNVTFISDYINSSYEIEVIGNIFDNPELMEAQNESKY